MADLQLDWEERHWPSGHPYWQATVDHDIRDEKGRAVGGYAHIHQYPAGAAALAAGYTAESAGKFNLSIQATRNGKRYGATPNGRLFTTLEEAQAEAGPALLRQRKSYLRKYTPAVTAPASSEPESLGSIW